MTAVGRMLVPVVLEFGRQHPPRGGVDGVHPGAVAQTPGDVWLVQEPLRRYTVEDSSTQITSSQILH